MFLFILMENIMCFYLYIYIHTDEIELVESVEYDKFIVFIPLYIYTHEIILKMVFFLVGETKRLPKSLKPLSDFQIYTFLRIPPTYKNNTIN